MTFVTLMGIALAIGTAVILGIALVSYMSSLARSAYELKVEMRKDLDDGIKHVETEMIKQTKWARGDLMAEVERTRTAMLEDLARRQQEVEAAFAAELKKRDETRAAEHEALTTAVADLGERVALLEQRLRSRLRPAEETAPEAMPPQPPAEPTATPPLLPELGGGPATAPLR